MELRALTTSASNLEIFDRLDKTSPGYFEKIEISPYNDEFQSILMDCKNLPIDQSVFERIEKTFSNKTFQYYSMDLIKILEAYRIQYPQKANRNEFQTLFNEIVATINFENFTTAAARYTTQLDVKTLENIHQISTLSKSSSEKIYINGVLNVSKNHEKVVVDMTPFASLCKSIPEKQKKTYQKILLTVQEFDFWKQRNDTEYGQTFSKIDVELDEANCDEKIGKFTIKTSSKRHFESDLNSDSEDPDFKCIKVSPDTAPVEKKSADTSKFMSEGNKYYPYVIIDKLNPDLPHSFKTIRLDHVNQKKTLNYVLENCKINPKIKERILEKTTGSQKTVFCNASDIFNLISHYRLMDAENKRGPDKISFSENLKHLEERSRQHIESETVQSGKDARYLFRIRLTTLQSVIGLTSLDQNSEVMKYFTRIITNAKPTTVSNKEAIVNMEHLVILIDHLSKTLLKEYPGAHSGLRKIVASFKKMINESVAKSPLIADEQDKKSLKFESELNAKDSNSFDIIFAQGNRAFFRGMLNSCNIDEDIKDRLQKQMDQPSNNVVCSYSDILSLMDTYINQHQQDNFSSIFITKYCTIYELVLNRSLNEKNETISKELTNDENPQMLVYQIPLNSGKKPEIDETEINFLNYLQREKPKSSCINTKVYPILDKKVPESLHSFQTIALQHKPFLKKVLEYSTVHQAVKKRINDIIQKKSPSSTYSSRDILDLLNNFPEDCKNDDFHRHFSKKFNEIFQAVSNTLYEEEALTKEARYIFKILKSTLKRLCENYKMKKEIEEIKFFLEAINKHFKDYNYIVIDMDKLVSLIENIKAKDIIKTDIFHTYKKIVRKFKDSKNVAVNSFVETHNSETFSTNKFNKELNWGDENCTQNLVKNSFKNSASAEMQIMKSNVIHLFADGLLEKK